MIRLKSSIKSLKSSPDSFSISDWRKVLETFSFTAVCIIPWIRVFAQCLFCTNIVTSCHARSRHRLEGSQACPPLIVVTIFNPAADISMSLRSPLLSRWLTIAHEWLVIEQHAMYSYSCLQNSWRSPNFYPFLVIEWTAKTRASVSHSILCQFW